MWFLLGHGTVYDLWHCKEVVKSQVQRHWHSSQDPVLLRQRSIWQDRDPGISMLHMAQHALTSACFMLHHRVQCITCPMINMIKYENAYNLDLQMAQDKEHNSDSFWKNCPKWDPADPEESLMNIHENFETPYWSSGSPYSLCWSSKSILGIQPIGNQISSWSRDVPSSPLTSTSLIMRGEECSVPQGAGWTPFPRICLWFSHMPFAMPNLRWSWQRLLPRHASISFGRPAMIALHSRSCSSKLSCIPSNTKGDSRATISRPTLPAMKLSSSRLPEGRDGYTGIDAGTLDKPFLKTAVQVQVAVPLQH